MDITIGHWVYSQHSKNPALPQLTRREVHGISHEITRGVAREIDIEEAQAFTQYPIKNYHNQFFLSSCNRWVIEANTAKPGLPLRVAAILSVPSVEVMDFDYNPDNTNSDLDQYLVAEEIPA